MICLVWIPWIYCINLRIKSSLRVPSAVAKTLQAALTQLSESKVILLVGCQMSTLYLLSIVILCISAQFAPADGGAGRAVSGGAIDRYPPLVVWKETQLDWFRFTNDVDEPKSFRQRILYSRAFWDNTTKV